MPAPSIESPGELTAHREGKAAFIADWQDALFVHFRVHPTVLQPLIPLPLDLRDGWAYLSLVAFTQRRLRPLVPTTVGRKVTAWLSKPLADHSFLNVRTYVRHANEPGIFFLAEWIPNRLAQLIGPRLYGLPYHLGHLNYHCDANRGTYRASVRARGRQLKLSARFDTTPEPSVCIRGSESAFLLERYTAYTWCSGICRRFHVEHAPWPQRTAQVLLHQHELLDGLSEQWRCVIPAGANYSQGVPDVRISSPQRVDI